MRVGKIASGFVMLVLAAAVTATAHFHDSVRARDRQSAFGLRTARQIAAQAEGLALQAKVGSNSDPITRAVSFLAQGVEPRTVQISKYRGPVGVPSEAYFLSSDGWFEYAKVLQPENGGGVKIRLLLGYRGFLDARSTFENDLFLVAFLLTIYFALQGLASLSVYLREMAGDRKPAARELPRAAPVQEPSFGAKVPAMVARGEGVLLQIGNRLVELLRETANFRGSVMVAIEERAESRGSLHAQLTKLHEARQALKTSGNAFDALDQVLKDGGALPSRENLRRWIAATKSMELRLEQVLRGVEVDLEPVATDLDLASHRDDDTRRIAQELNGRIEAVKQALKDQALFVRELQDLARDSGADEKPAA